MFFANETVNKMGQSELNVIRVIGEYASTKNEQKAYKCETAFFIEGMFVDFYESVWLEEFLHRGARGDEIAVFREVAGTVNGITN